MTWLGAVERCLGTDERCGGDVAGFEQLAKAMGARVIKGSTDAVNVETSPRLLLSGYYGFGNCGDEAILAGALQGFRELARIVAHRLNVFRIDSDWRQNAG